MLKYFLN